MEYELTQHASDALVRRQIPVIWVERVLAEPAWKEVDAVDLNLEHRLGPIVEFENRVLRVFLNCNVTPPRIVTVYFDRGVARP